MFQRSFEDIVNNADTENAVNFLLTCKSSSVHTFKIHTILFQCIQAADDELFQHPRVESWLRMMLQVVPF